MNRPEKLSPLHIKACAEEWNVHGVAGSACTLCGCRLRETCGAVVLSKGFRQREGTSDPTGVLVVEVCLGSHHLTCHGK